MKAILTAALLAATLVPARATPMDEATRTQFIGGAMKTCMQTNNSSEIVKRAWPQTDISNYCGCYSVTLSNSITEEDLTYLATTGGKFPPDVLDRAVKPAANYCSKYLPTPDVSGIKDKKW